MRIEFEFVSQEMFHICVFASCHKIDFWERGVVCVSNSNSMVLRIDHVCIQFLGRPLKST